MSLSEKIQALCERRRFGMQLGLDRMRALMDELGHPESDLAAIHVAGTNGKGSVTAIIASVLQEAGFGPVGRYTSPHLVYFNERICINGVPVVDDVLEPAVDKVEAACRRVEAAGAGMPTFFEAVTAIAFEVFRSQGVRIAAIETGLGGRLDATNILLPVLSVITCIGLEHRQYLGDTVEQIAAEKAGILKPGRPAVLGRTMDERARAVIEAAAGRIGAKVVDPGVSVASSKLSAKSPGAKISFEDNVRSLTGIRFPLPGAYQLENLTTALSALEVFSSATGLPISDEAFRKGLEKVSWPCRFQKVADDPAVIVDGAHNPNAAEALAETLRGLRPKRPLALIAGFCDDKDSLLCLRSLHPHFRRGWAVDVPSPRTLPAADLAARFRTAGWRDVEAVPDWKEGLSQAMEWARAQDGAVIVCGSLFLAGAVADHFHALPWQRGIATPNESLKPTK